MLSKDEVQHNATEIKNLIKKFVKIDGDNPATIVDNSEWINKETYIDFLSEVGCHFNINEMLTKDLYKSRLAQGGLTFMEMGNMLIQAFDFVHLNDKFNCILQIGGSDQWGNICAGVDLSRKMSFKDGIARPLMLGLCCPLLTNSEGVKMGKTEKRTLWVSRNKTSSFEFFQHFVNCLDADVKRLLRFFTDIEVEKIKQMCKDNIVEAKKFMAFKVTELVHGSDEAEKAKKTAEDLFVNKTNATDMPTEQIEIKQQITVLDFISKLSIVKSKSEARRLIE